MKKLTLALAFLLATSAIKAQQPWMNKLNNADDEDNSKFGTSNSVPVNFFTDNIKRMTLDIDGHLKINDLGGTGRRFLQADANGMLFPATGFCSTEAGHLKLATGLKFGLGVGSPAVALDVNGSGKFTENLKVSGGLLMNDASTTGGSFGMKYLPPTLTRPATMAFVLVPLDPDNLPVLPHDNMLGMPCTAFPVNYAEGQGRDNNSFTAAATFPDLVQIFNAGNGVILNMGINNGHGIIAVENGNAKLRLNPGCSNDVYICEGGGFTKIFNSAGIVGDLAVSHDATVSRNLNILNLMKLGTGTFSQDAQLDIIYNGGVAGNDALRVENPSLSQTNNKIFEVTGSGKTLIGHNLPASSAMLTVGQAVKTDPALRLTDNTSTSNKDYFKVYGNGYTEIDVYSPLGMPNGRVVAVLDKYNNKDLFVLKSDGKMYAREVEISLATTFPDYVFDKAYSLRPIAEVAAFIAQHKHLPGFEKGAYYESNGINVTGMFVKQQEKIEELTLYIIALEKRLQALEKNK